MKDGKAMGRAVCPHFGAVGLPGASQRSRIHAWRRRNARVERTSSLELEQARWYTGTCRCTHAQVTQRIEVCERRHRQCRRCCPFSCVCVCLFYIMPLFFSYHLLHLWRASPLSRMHAPARTLIRDPTRRGSGGGRSCTVTDPQLSPPPSSGDERVRVREAVLFPLLSPYPTDACARASCLLPFLLAHLHARTPCRHLSLLILHRYAQRACLAQENNRKRTRGGSL